MTDEMKSADLLALTADIVSAHVSNNVVAVSDLSVLIGNVYDSLSTLGAVPAVEVSVQKPAVSVRSSVKPDHIICLEDGKKQKTLKRHLMTSHGLTPDTYRAKWDLPADYPMVAPDYAAQRSAMAKQIGLGRKAGSKVVANIELGKVPVDGPKKRGRPKLRIASK